MKPSQSKGIIKRRPVSPLILDSAGKAVGLALALLAASIFNQKGNSSGKCNA